MVNGKSDSHGLAPSATISIRMEDKLVSFWSLWAIMAQWRSRHLTKATRAMKGHKGFEFDNHALT